MTFDYSPQLKVLWIEGWIIYLRKSRQDDPNQTIEEVLAKHEAMLQEYAEREIGGRIPEENIYREVVSGERIDERVEIKKVLARIEDPNIKGVLVMEPSRLSRGDLKDCGRLIDAFRFTHTLVATPMMTYDLEKKMERKFFQDELLRGNDYLEYTKEILFRGRIAAAKRGCYIPAHPPYGYNRIKIGRDWTLEANDDADTVRMMYTWYVNEGLTPGAIGRRLDTMGIEPPRGGKWNRYTVRDILSNIHYIGKIKFNERKATWVMENGEQTKRWLLAPEDEVVISEGKHAAIIDLATFEAAQARMAQHPRVKKDRDLINPLSGILRCSKCGKVLIYEAKKGAKARYRCRNTPSCFKSAKADEVEAAVLFLLENVELPNLQTKLKNGDGDAAAIQKRRIDKLVKQMEEYRAQEDKQYELLETRKYTQEVFDRRNAVLREKMETCERELHQARSALPQNVDYAERIVKLEEAIKAMKDPAMTIKEKNKILRAIISRIIFSSTDEGFNKTGVQLEVFLKL